MLRVPQSPSADLKLRISIPLFITCCCSPPYRLPTMVFSSSVHHHLFHVCPTHLPVSTSTHWYLHSIVFVLFAYIHIFIFFFILSLRLNFVRHFHIRLILKTPILRGLFCCFVCRGFLLVVGGFVVWFFFFSY